MLTDDKRDWSRHLKEVRKCEGRDVNTEVLRWACEAVLKTGEILVNERNRS